MSEVERTEESRRGDHGGAGEPDNLKTLSSISLLPGQQGDLYRRKTLGEETGFNLYRRIFFFFLVDQGLTVFS